MTSVVVIESTSNLYWKTQKRTREYYVRSTHSDWL